MKIFIYTNNDKLGYTIEEKNLYSDTSCVIKTNENIRDFLLNELERSSRVIALFNGLNGGTKSTVLKAKKCILKQP